MGSLCTDKSTPLHAAVSAGFPDCVRFLLENGHQPVPLDKAGFTPLHIAAILENPGPLKMYDYRSAHALGWFARVLMQCDVTAACW